MYSSNFWSSIANPIINHGRPTLDTSTRESTTGLNTFLHFVRMFIREEQQILRFAPSYLFLIHHRFLRQYQPLFPAMSICSGCIVTHKANPFLNLSTATVEIPGTYMHPSH